MFLLIFTLLPSLLSAAPQDQAAPTFNVEATLTRIQRDGKVSSESNKVELQANGKTASSHLGSSVPVQVANIVIMQMVGNQLDGSLTRMADGRYSLAITVTHRSVVDEAQAARISQRVPGIPVFQNVIYAGTLIIADGETVQFTAPDLLNNDVWEGRIALSAKQLVSGTSQIPAGVQVQDVTVKTQFVVTRAEADKETTATYTLPAASGVMAQLRVGYEVPMAVSGATGLPFTVQQVGTQIDEIVKSAAEGRFTLQETVTLRTLPANGRLKNFVGVGTLTLRDGEPVHSSLVDRETGEMHALDVTVTTVR